MSFTVTMEFASPPLKPSIFLEHDKLFWWIILNKWLLLVQRDDLLTLAKMLGAETGSVIYCTSKIQPRFTDIK